MGISLTKMMPIINHRYFKSQAFCFKKFNLPNAPFSRHKRR
jgi:hypothetical protein